MKMTTRTTNTMRPVRAFFAIASPQVGPIEEVLTSVDPVGGQGLGDDVDLVERQRLGLDPDGVVVGRHHDRALGRLDAGPGDGVR